MPDLTLSSGERADTERHIANLPNSAIRMRAHLTPVDAANAIIALRAELDAIYGAADISLSALYDAVKKSQARMREL